MGIRLMDRDDSGSVSLEEIMVGAEDEEFAEQLAKLDVDKGDLQEIFGLMDCDDSGTVSYDEFVDSFHTAQNQDWRIYLMVMKLQNKKVYENFGMRFDRLEELITGNV